jgi:hypothetical protein
MTSREPSPPNRRRIDRISGGVLAVLGIAVAVVALVALRHPNGRQAKPVSLRTQTSTVTATPPTSTKTVTKSPTPSGSTTGSSTGSSTATAHPVPLIVLNSTTVTGLADTAKQRFVAGGWTVTSTGNIVNDIISTCAYYDPNTAGAEAAAEQLQQQFPAIKRVKEKFSGLPDGPIVVVLTTDYS